MNSKQSQVIDLEGGHSSQDVIDLDAIMLDQYDATDLWEEARLSEVFAYAHDTVLSRNAETRFA